MTAEKKQELRALPFVSRQTAQDEQDEPCAKMLSWMAKAGSRTAQNSIAARTSSLLASLAYLQRQGLACGRRLGRRMGGLEVGCNRGISTAHLMPSTPYLRLVQLCSHLSSTNLDGIHGRACVRACRAPGWMAPHGTAAHPRPDASTQQLSHGGTSPTRQPRCVGYTMLMPGCRSYSILHPSVILPAYPRRLAGPPKIGSCERGRTWTVE